MISEAEQPRQIYELMTNAMRDVGVIPLGDKNTQQNYSFRGVYRALSVVSPVLIRHGITMATEVHDYQCEYIKWTDKNGKDQNIFHATLLMDVTFHAPDGSSMKNTLAGEGMDYAGDKATNKAMSAAVKYGFFFGLVIPVNKNDIDDSDTDPTKAKKRDRKFDPTPVSQPTKDENHVAALAPVMTKEDCDKAEKALRAAADDPTIDKYMDSIRKRFSKDQVIYLDIVAHECRQKISETANA